jgi:hypothetical protein
MDSKDIIELYFEWLIDQVCYEDEKDKYSDVLRLLHSTTFRYMLDRDANRAADGINMRNFFGNEHNIDPETRHNAISGPCSVLEMLVALADRASYSMIDEEIAGDDEPMHWIFWLMMKNIGLIRLSNGLFSHSKAMRHINVFMDRKYAENGRKGGLFVVNKSKKDLRNVEIWYQMCWSISEMTDLE